MGLTFTVISILLAVASIAIAIQFSSEKPRWWRRAIVCLFGQDAPELPDYHDAANRSRDAYRQRLREYLEANSGSLSELGIGPADDPLSPSVPHKECGIDSLCTALSCGGKTYILLVSGESEPDVEGVGRTSLTVRLLNLRLPYTRLIGLRGGDRLDQKHLDIRFRDSGSWSLITSDMAYIVASEGRLCVIPTKGEKLNFLWDLARHLFRSTDLGYSTGAHRDHRNRPFLLDLFGAIPWQGISSVYAQSLHLYRVDEIVFIKRTVAPQKERPTVRFLANSEGLTKLERSLVLASDRHGSEFWRRPSSSLLARVRYVIDNTDPRHIPPMRELAVNAVNGATPGYLYDEAAAVLSGTSPATLPPLSPGSVVQGISGYNRLLFEALPAVSTLRMLVISGEKVFRDGAFWRTLSQSRREVHIEILMLDPFSPAVEELQKSTYNDKAQGFLRQEIQENLAVLERVITEMKRGRRSPSIEYRLYTCRPAWRLTILDDSRAIIAPYLTHSRTGDSTIFTDTSGPSAAAFVSALIKEFGRIKEMSRVPHAHAWTR